jgi:hypothetical protein
VPGANINNKSEISGENYIRYIIDILGGVEVGSRPPQTPPIQKRARERILLIS